MEKLCNVSEVPEGTMKGFSAKGEQILVANVNGKFYAMDAVCSHNYGYLPKGRLEKNIVTCPVHHAQFDVTNVNPLMRFTGSAKNLKTFKAVEV